MTDIFWREGQFILALYCVGGPCFIKQKESFSVFYFCFLFVCFWKQILLCGFVFNVSY